jgi:hypothetical protein
LCCQPTGLMVVGQWLLVYGLLLLEPVHPKNSIKVKSDHILQQTTSGLSKDCERTGHFR